MPSLRERKRRATMQAIEEHATALALEHGFDNVTVEDICAEAEISKRTFFNYVESKEAAILGPPPSALSQEQRDAFLSKRHEKIILDTALLMIEKFQRSGDVNPVIRVRRRKLCAGNPTFIHFFESGAQALMRSVIDCIVEYFKHYPEEFHDAEGSVRDTAKMLASFALIVTKTACIAWFEDSEDNNPDLGELCRDAYVRLGHCVQNYYF